MKIPTDYVGNMLTRGQAVIAPMTSGRKRNGAAIIRIGRITRTTPCRVFFHVYSPLPNGEWEKLKDEGSCFHENVIVVPWGSVAKVCGEGLALQFVRETTRPQPDNK